MTRLYVQLEFVGGSRYDGQVIEWVDDYTPRQAKRLRHLHRAREQSQVEAGGVSYPVVIREAMEVDPREVGVRAYGDLPALTVLGHGDVRWNTR